ncbi:MAG: PLP-dependent aminotransferase family protein [Deltaproteobacteria bacterium]|nr:PLP-dependent aminotransferase family protein [Deltaproteobacteria bacterium]
MFLTVDRDDAAPMSRQIYSRLRELILAGGLPAGAKLPSSRALAKELGVSRNVTLEAYDLLYAEGFTEAARGSGTFVAEGTSFAPAAPKAPLEVDVGEEEGGGYPGAILFRSGTPDLSLFPARLWLSLLREAFAGGTCEILGYGRPEGRPELRGAIREHVVSRRGVVCSDDQIVITMGATQGVGIAAALLASENASNSDARRVVVVEDPVTEGLQRILEAFRVTLRPVPADELGMRTDLLSGATPAFVYVTPSHQYPIGGTLPIRRRLELLRYARDTGCYVLEDDYDSEFRFDGPPLSSVHSLDPSRVIYAGTFSKTLCPAIRVGYLVLPPELVATARTLKWRNDLHNEIATQLALAAFIRRGYYVRHLARMRKVYARRRSATVEALSESFGSDVKILGSATGLHLCARWEGVVFTPEVLADLAREGCVVRSAASHCLVSPERYEDTLILGYGNLKETEIRRGVEILRRVRSLNRNARMTSSVSSVLLEGALPCPSFPPSSRG